MTLFVAAAVLVAGAVVLFGLFFGVGMLLGKRIDRAVMARIDTETAPATDETPQEVAAAAQAATEGRKENDGRE